MIRIIIEHIIWNIILFCACLIFMYNDSDIAKESLLYDTFICWLLCAIVIYGMFGIIWFIISHGGHLMPLL